MQNCTAVDESLTNNVGLETPCFIAHLLPQLMDLVRASRRLPLGEEYAIRRGSRDFSAASRDLGQRSVAVAHQALRFLNPGQHRSPTPTDISNFNLVEDVIDNVLERVDACLRDAVAGVGVQDQRSSQNLQAEPEQVASSTQSKPQVRWRHLVDNHRTVFVPRLLLKHNASTALSESLLAMQRRVGIRLGEFNQTAPEPNASGASHAMLAHLGSLGVGSTAALENPYAHELSSLSWPDSFFDIRPPHRFQRMEDTPLIWVRAPSALHEMISEIKATCQGGEIAVDVEHHDFRTYRGFVCLVQISTRQKDFLIDPFDMFEQMHFLNEVFSDPNILKVLHGSDRDVMWLQRDFSVYLVNMFDTGLATRALRLQGGFSLANLVSHCCGVRLDKKYQTADWRRRPMSEEMSQYARCDTHYLLYCFDCVRNALLMQTPQQITSSAIYHEGSVATEEGEAALRGVLERSTALCRGQYSEPTFDAANAAVALQERFSSRRQPLEARQFSALRGLVAWRDRLARRLDESLNFVAPDPCLWRFALALPSSSARLRSICNPLPALVSQHAAEVVDMINSAKGAESGLSTEGAQLTVPTCSPLLGPLLRGLSKAAGSKRNTHRTSTDSHSQTWPSGMVSSKPVLHLESGARLNIGSTQCTLWGVFASESSDEGEAEHADNSKVDAGHVSEIRAALRFATHAPEAPLSAEEAPLACVNEQAAESHNSEQPLSDQSTETAPKSLREQYSLANPSRRARRVVRCETRLVQQQESSLDVEAGRLRKAFDCEVRGDGVVESKKRHASSVGMERGAKTTLATTVDPYAVPEDPSRRRRKRRKKVADAGSVPTMVDPYL